MIFCGTLLTPGLLWRARNYAVHGEATSIYSSISVRHLWTGANPEYGPYFYSRGSFHETLWRHPEAAELERISWMQEEAHTFIQADPLQFAAATLWRMRLLFPELARPFSSFDWRQPNLFLLYFLSLFATSIVGILFYALHTLTRPFPDAPARKWLFLYAGGIALSVLGAGVYGASSRYRWPLEFVWIPFAAYLLVTLFSLSGKVNVHHRTPSGLWSFLIRGWLVLLGLHGVHLLYKHQIHPAPVVSRNPRVSAEELLNRFRSEAPKAAASPRLDLAYSDIFANQAAHYGDLTAYRSEHVLWWGIVRFPEYNGAGHLIRGEIVLNAEDGELGDVRLPFVIRNPQRLQLRHIANLPIRFIAELQFDSKSLSMPVLKIYYAEIGALNPRDPVPSGQ
jgi:hypothetical protein